MGELGPLEELADREFGSYRNPQGIFINQVRAESGSSLRRAPMSAMHEEYTSIRY